MKALLKALRPRATETNPAGDGSMSEVVSVLCRQMKDVHEELSQLHAQTAEAQRQVEQLLALERGYVNERASLAAIPCARLLSTSIALEGSPTERLRVRRLSVGEPVERPFSRSLGLTRCATDAADVRELWERLLAFEAECGQDVLRGLPAAVLDVPDAIVSVTDGNSLRISVGGTPQQAAPVVAVPRFTYDCPPRKLYNFGHWLLDCAPQIAVLAKIAPDALFLLPDPCREFQQATLALLGVDRRQLVPWNGSPLGCRRLLALESDGRSGGGRPLSPLMEVRQLLAPRATNVSDARKGRVYVSRRDADASRRWVTNELEVEMLFRSRGFDIVVMAECPLDEQVRIFQEAGVVAGVSGAGLTDVVFSRPGTDVIVLLSDSLIRWYADERGARSLWSGGSRAKGGQLSALGDSPRFYAHLAAAFEQRCHAFVAGDQMPLDRLAGFLDDVLAGADRP